MTWYWYGYSIETIVLIVFLTIYDLVLNRMWEIFLYLSNYLSGSCQGYCTSESSKKPTDISIFDWRGETSSVYVTNTGDVVLLRQFLLTL